MIKYFVAEKKQKWEKPEYLKKHGVFIDAQNVCFFSENAKKAEKCKISEIDEILDLIYFIKCNVYQK